MPHSPTYQHIVLGKRKTAKGKEKKLKTVKYEKRKETSRTLKKKGKKSDYRIENTHRSAGKPTDRWGGGGWEELPLPNTMAHNIPKLLPCYR